MKNFYEILEVDKKASFEVIDKAYKVLAKKYHPDMHPEEKKQWAEEHFKEISEAYETLSNEEKRSAYNQELDSSVVDYSKKYEELCKQQEILKQELEILRNQKMQAQTSYARQTQAPSSTYAQNQYHPNQTYQQNVAPQPDLNEIRQEEFNRAYHSILQSLGYTFRQKRTFKDFLALLITLAILVFLFFLLWHIPFTKAYLIAFYENNSIIKGIVDLFLH